MVHATDLGFSSRPRQAKEVSDIGDLIGDRYRIEQVLREDAITSTVSARHLALEERVFVQVLRPELRFDKRRTVQYLKAIKALAHIKTDHVVRVLDVGVALFLGPFLVMEELEGSTLAEVLRAEGPLPLPRAVEYVLQACKGLAMAHAAGIVHGQLDTSRLLLARRGAFETLKVTEFPTLGVALEDRGYLAPEVIRGEAPIDARADVWSLGAVLFELVSGRPALTSAGPAEIGQDDAALSPALRRIIARCLQPEPAQRFSDVDELAAELLPLTTLNEVFRGSLTGSFSRQMMLAAAAQAQAEARVKRSVQPATPAWRVRLGRLRSLLSELDWRARGRALEQSWKQLVPEGPTLLEALAGAGGALLIGLACVSLGHADLMPPPSSRAPALTVVTAALQPAPVPAPDLTPQAPAPPADSVVEPTVPAAAEPANAGESPVAPSKRPSSASKQRRHGKARAVRRHQ